MSDTMMFQDLWVEKDAEDILWVHINQKDSPVNVLGTALLEELEKLIDSIDTFKPVKAMVFISDKKAAFIAGADVKEIAEVKDSNEAIDYVHHVHAIFSKLDNLSVLTIAAIHKVCLGGGLEFALACDYRIATDDEGTRFGLPEVKIGFHPGWGGTVRLPRVAGIFNAMDLMLTGRTVDARAGKAMGFLDEVVPYRQLKRAAHYYAMNPPAQRKLPSYYEVLEISPLRSLLGYFFLRKLKATGVKESHYPAPYAIISNWVQNGSLSEKAFQAEANSVSKLVMTPTSKCLVRVFLLNQRVKRLAKEVSFKPKHIHVIGAGTMGGDIAAWCAYRGYHVTLEDREPKYLAPAYKRAVALFQKKLKIHRLVEGARDRLFLDPKGLGIKNADVIIEAIYEDLAAKQAVFSRVEKEAKPSAILATNTSSIPLDEINTCLKNPERLVGIHFFNPVAQMMLVEIVRSNKTSDEIFNQAMSFVDGLDKLALPVRSRPGFLVNRILMPYLLKAIEFVNDGMPMEVVDKAAVDFGMPMGPVELSDTVGLDVCFSVAKNLVAHFGGTIPAILEEKVKAGELGRKSGQGFYKFENGKPVKDNSAVLPPNAAEVAEKLWREMLAEANKCLEEGVVSDEDLLDAGIIFGTGFAPFRGGLMHYAKSIEK